jgi:thioredoxin 1
MMSKPVKVDTNIFDVTERPDGTFVVRVVGLDTEYEAETLEAAVRAAAEQTVRLQETAEGRARMREHGLLDAFLRSRDQLRDRHPGGETEVHPKVPELTNDGFDQLTGTGGSLIDFWAPWCVPCKQLAPIVDRLAERFAGTIRFASVDIDEQPELTARCEVISVPTLVGYLDGAERLRMVGVPRPADLEAAILERLCEGG